MMSGAGTGIKLFQKVLDPEACPGHDPGTTGVKAWGTLYEAVKFADKPVVATINRIEFNTG